MSGVGRKISLIAASLLALAYVGVTFAEDGCTGPSDDCVTVGRWNLSVTLGAGVRTNPLAHSRNIPLFLVPQFSYYGKRFFLDNLDPGVTLFEGDVNTVSLIASPGYDRVFFYRSDLQNFFIGAGNSGGGYNSLVVTPRGEKPPPGYPVEVPQRARKVTYLAGPEWTFKYGDVAGQVDYLHEVTGRNHGDEIRAGLGIPLGELGGAWKVNLGLTWKSAAIVNYYYGLPEVYDPGAAINPFIKLGYSRPLSRKWKLDAFVHCERLGQSIANSPLIGQRYVMTAFVGATYVFHK